MANPTKVSSSVDTDFAPLTGQSIPYGQRGTDYDKAFSSTIIKNSPDLIEGHVLDEEDAVWVPSEPGIDNRMVMLDLNRNSFAVVVRMQPGSNIQRHHHMGPVLGYGLKGTWKYREYDWIVKPGTFLYEPPGEAHS